MNEKSKARQWFESSTEGNETYQAFRSYVAAEELINGRTIEDWHKHFHLDIPESPDPEICKRLDMHVMALHQEATLHQNVARACLDAATITSDIEYRKKYTQFANTLGRQNGKLPSATTLEALAKGELEDIERIRELARREVEFWKNIKIDLDMRRRLINDATINNGIQVKMDLHSGMGNVYNTPDRE